MPNIKVIYWNIQDFGDAHNQRRGDYTPLCNFIAQVVQNIDADILFLMELRKTGIGFPLTQLQLALLNAYNIGGVQTCDWYCDWIPGCFVNNTGRNSVADPNEVRFTGQGRYEGYAVFWKQNIDKFIMQPADPIDPNTTTPPNLHPQAGNPPNGFVNNTQSDGVRARFQQPIGLNPLLNNIQVLPQNQGEYILSQGTIAGQNGIRRGNQMIVPVGQQIQQAFHLRAGDIISQGTSIGFGGVRLNQSVGGVFPIVIPGMYRLTTNLTLPPADSILVPLHILSLVLSGRNGNYDPNNPNNIVWEHLPFPATNGSILWNGSRRPAYCTIKANIEGGSPHQLIPLTVYHAPLSAPQQAMIQCSISRSLYQAYDHQGGAYIANNISIVGGDFNSRLDPDAQHYIFYTNAFNQGGAGCHENNGNPNIRVNNALPAGFAPQFPPPANPPTVADNPQNKSTVQLLHPVVPIPGQPAPLPVLSAQTEHYRRAAIDNIFYRGFGFIEVIPGLVVNRQAPHNNFGDIYDLVEAITGAAAPGIAPNFHIPAPIIQNFQGLPIFNPQGGQGPVAPAAGINNVLNAATLLQDIQQGLFGNIVPNNPPAGMGQFAGPAGLNAAGVPQYSGPAGQGAIPNVITPARRAAEFIKLFVSDHLPVIFEIDL
ncbi:MAG: hypothetical protein SAK29_27680 [Scytonema sp. PMC 1069.18]|nr:hypothetical protein [Scytonema sp. PMC 1069.18]MEC4882033.1 hypothetical protein [Scytonema sp. PMC 1070.18]